MDGTRSDRVTAATWGDAARGAAAGGAGAFLAIAAVRHGIPAQFLEVVGPPPLPFLLAAVSLVAAPVAGALVGRRAVRAKGSPIRRTWRLVVWTFVAYLGTVTAAATVTSLVRYGPSPLVMPFGLIGYCLGVALLLLPWSAIPILGTALVIEGWTRPAPRGHRPWSFPLAVMLTAGAVLLLA